MSSYHSCLNVAPLKSFKSSSKFLHFLSFITSDDDEDDVLYDDSADNINVGNMTAIVVEDDIDLDCVDIVIDVSERILHYSEMKLMTQ